MRASIRLVACFGLLALLLRAAPWAPARAGDELRLPGVFGSHMVLQRDVPVPVWGWARAGETVTVSCAGARAQAKVNEAGEWKAVLPALKAGGPHTLSVEGSSTLRLEDVLVGEVWLCSGQSNMEMGVGACRDGAAEIAAAHHPRIRLLMVPNRFAALPERDIVVGAQDGAWRVCSPATVAQGGWGGFSAAAYYFGRELEQALDVPVGLIDATWGGTVIQTWTPAEGFALVPELATEHERVLLADARSESHRKRLAETIEEAERWATAAKQALADRAAPPAMPVFPPELLPPSGPQHATALCNGMIQPLCPYALRGAIWYQGESNLGDGLLYTSRMQALIGGWRALWAQPELAFYFVQIAPFNYGGSPQAEPLLWEAQAAAQSIPGTGMVVINDIGNLADIHPANKQDVGRRLARWALAKTYGKKVECSGPTVREVVPEGGRLRVKFDHAGTGLSTRDGKPPTWFEVIDADGGGFVKATAKLAGDAVLLSAPDVRKPVAVRFAWSMLAEPNLMSSEGLPAGAFRAGTLPDRDPLTRHVPEAKDYTLVYDLDLAKLGPAPAYAADAHATLTRPFDRVAYLVELADAAGEARFVYVSMDAFTTELAQVGVPTAASGARFQQDVANLTVISNVKGLVTGARLKGGSIEFWPHNYGPANAVAVPGASDAAWDYGDQPSDPRDGYGSMQVHNHEAKQTLFALNNWKAGAGADLGIGSQPSGNPDWTFAANAGTYAAKRLRVLVRLR